MAAIMAAGENIGSGGEKPSGVKRRRKRVAASKEKK
jgi:hypothetical protein